MLQNPGPGNCQKLIVSGAIDLKNRPHLFFKPDADHIRLLQTAMIVRQLEKIKTSAEKNFGMAFSVLLCGDFNSTPPFGVLEFMQQKVIKENHTDWCSAEGIVQFYS